MNPVPHPGPRWAWLFANVLAAKASHRDPLYHRLDAARRLLDAELEERLTLDDVARHAHLSKFHFLRLFKAAFAETPHRYHRRRRLESAQRLLARTEIPVTDVCFRVGFDSLGAFCNIFRREVGLSPGGFRRRYVVVPRSVVGPERAIPCCWLRRYRLTPPAPIPPTPQF